MAGWVATREVAGRAGRANDKNLRTYDREYLVQFDGPDGTEVEARAAPNVPLLFHPHPADLGCLVVEVTPVQDRQCPEFWRVLVRYSSDQVRPDTVIDNPLLRPPEIRWSTEVVKVAATVDRDGNAIISSSKETFDPPPEVQRRRLVLNYTRNRQDFGAPEFVERWNDKVNSQQWYGFSAETAKIDDLTVEEDQQNNVSFWRESWVIKIDKTQDADGNQIGWALRPLDQGYYKITGGTRELITDTSGRPLQSAALLDGSGGALAVGGTPVYKTFHVYETADFNELGIP